MANGHGGKRVPANPAPASGPGALSRRTDGQPVRQVTGGPYGENGDFAELQSSAPMSNTAKTQRPSRAAARPQGGQPAGPAGLVGLGEPSQYPDEPVTAGSPSGLGPGPEVLSAPFDSMNREETARLAAYLPALEHAARQPDSPDSFRRFVRYVRDQVR